MSVKVSFISLRGDLFCVTAIISKLHGKDDICFGFVRKVTELRLFLLVKGQAACHISLSSIITSDGCDLEEKKRFALCTCYTLFSVESPFGFCYLSSLQLVIERVDEFWLHHTEGLNVLPFWSLKTPYVMVWHLATVNLSAFVSPKGKVCCLALITRLWNFFIFFFFSMVFIGSEFDMFRGRSALLCHHPKPLSCFSTVPCAVNQYLKYKGCCHASIVYCVL